MNEQTFPLGWNEDRVRRLIAKFEVLTEEEVVVDDSAVSFPESVGREVGRRRHEMRDGHFGITHDEVWRRIEDRKE
jgi:hypothetical protein